MIKNKGAIGARELVSILFMLLTLKATDMTPIMLYPKGENATWMIIFFGGLINFLPFLLLFPILKHYENKNLLAITDDLLGKKIGFLIGVSLLIIVMTATIIDSRSYADIVNAMYLKKTPLAVTYLVMMLTSTFIAKQGFQIIGRVAFLLMPLILIIAIALFSFIYKDLVWGRVLPIFGCGYKGIIKYGFLNNGLFAELLGFAIIFPYLRNTKSFKLGMTIGFIGSWLMLILFYIVFVALFSFPSVENVSYPFHEAIRYLDITEILTNNEVFFFGFWLYTSIVRFSFYIYMSAIIFAYLFKINEFEPLVVPIGFISFLLGLIPENAVIYTLHIRDSLLIPTTSAFSILLPVLLYIVAKWKGVLGS